MKKIILLIFTTFIFSANLFAQKVASYATGLPGEDNYENLSFWIKDGKRTFVSYTYGADRKEAKITYIGKATYKGVPCFKVQFTNKQFLYIMANGPQLEIAGPNDYLKTFKWEYEGPINGIGSFCSVCATDEKDAMQLLKDYYF